MNACPDCDRPLPQTAKACKCGWKLGTLSVGVDVCRCECGATAIMWRDGRDWCEPCYGLYRGEQARASMGELNLDRLPGEPIEVWRKRVLNWLRENATVKTFGRAA